MTNTNVFTSSVVIASKIAMDTVVMDSKVVYNASILAAAAGLTVSAIGLDSLNDKKEVLLDKMDVKFNTLANKIAKLNAKREAKRAVKIAEVVEFNGAAVA